MKKRTIMIVIIVMLIVGFSVAANTKKNEAEWTGELVLRVSAHNTMHRSILNVNLENGQDTWFYILNTLEDKKDRTIVFDEIVVTYSEIKVLMYQDHRVKYLIWDPDSNLPFPVLPPKEIIVVVSDGNKEHEKLTGFRLEVTETAYIKNGKMSADGFLGREDHYMYKFTIKKP